LIQKIIELKVPQNFVLHPLIHTSLGFAQAQDVEKKKAETETPHFLSSNQDIVYWAKEEKCQLKHVMFTQSEKSAELLAPSECSEWLGGTGSCHPIGR